jgi:multicomponent Na+:H+ antiporter subunit D
LLLGVSAGATDWQFMGLDLVPLRVDGVSLVWGHVFHLAALLSAVYAIHDNDRLSAGMGAVYAGASIAGVFAGDLLTLFVFWELTAISSVFLIWAGRSSASYGAGMRYLLVHVGSGVLLFAGAVLFLQTEGNLRFGGVNEIGVFRDSLSQLSGKLLLLAFGIKAAFPLLHAWLPDAYPESTPSGGVYLSAFTTKMAIYALLRGFAGWEPLIAVGCVMALAPLVYALVADDIRRCLAYCLNNQLGFMVVAVGVGSELAINGVAAHAVAHILYKGLLFMVAGAVLYRTGTAKTSELGGLATHMPWTFAGHVIGVAAIATPLFSGFVTKSLSLSAVAEAHHAWAWVALLTATAGVFFVLGLRITYDVFLSERKSHPDTSSSGEAPWNMRVAMGIAAGCCLLLGLFPEWLYRRLPYPVDYHAYTIPHVVSQLQLMLWSALVFVLLLRFRFYPLAEPGTLLDFDWFYRVPLRALAQRLREVGRWLDSQTSTAARRMLGSGGKLLERALSDQGSRGHFPSTGQMAMWAAVMLVIYLLVYYR